MRDQGQRFCDAIPGEELCYAIPGEGFYYVIPGEGFCYAIPDAKAMNSDGSLLFWSVANGTASDRVGGNE